MKTDTGLSFKNSPVHIDRAKSLRKIGTLAERLLWNALTGMRQETKLKFRRQHPLHPYIADFACIKAKLIVELDGISHDARPVYDKERDAVLRRRGWRILRFANDDVLNNLEGVVLTILNSANQALPRPLP